MNTHFLTLLPRRALKSSLFAVCTLWSSRAVMVLSWVQCQGGSVKWVNTRMAGKGNYTNRSKLPNWIKGLQHSYANNGPLLLRRAPTTHSHTGYMPSSPHDTGEPRGKGCWSTGARDSWQWEKKKWPKYGENMATWRLGETKVAHSSTPQT